MALTQANRLLGLKTPLGANTLIMTAFHGHEELSRLFSYDLDLISDSPAITPQSIVGKNVTFSIKLADDSPRFFNGFISQFYAGNEHQGRRNYRARVVPWLWFLTRTSDCRIFQNKSVPDIVQQIFKDLGFSDFEPRLSGHHPKRDYCVQYRETDFNFVSRLMEEEGIFYYFKHQDGKHVLVFSDEKGAYFNCGEKTVDFPRDHGGHHIHDHISAWEHRYEFRSGKWAQTDYNFETPTTSLMTNTSTVVPLPDAAKYEFYDYPGTGTYLNKANGTPLTKDRMEEEEVEYDIVHASSKCRTFTPGGKFKIDKHHAAAEQGKTYVITGIQHSAHETLGHESGASHAGEDYTNSFTCIPESVTFRPARLTPKPVVHGVQTAVIVGPKGEEIYCDKYGRVKVQFHWDREGKKNETSSCWMRSAHNVAGKQWGFMAIPRIGQEVVVDFLEGDPDCPLIVGSVYNAGQMPHYALPAEQTKTYIKTNSSKGGKGYNELMFEDKKDDERVYIHAEKNMDVRVKNDSKTRIFGNRHQIIGWEKDGKKGGSQFEEVYQDKVLNIKRDQIEQIEGNMQLMIGHGKADSGGNLDIVVEKNKAELIEADSDLHIKGNHSEQVDGGLSLTVGGDQNHKVGGNVAVEAGAAGEIHLKAGMKVIIEAGMQLSLKGPGGFIDIGPAGVSIQGTMVLINSGGSAGAGKGCKAKAPKAPKQAAPKAPELAWDSKTGMKSAPD